MVDLLKIENTLSTSPSVDLLKTRHREKIILFLVKSFSNQEGAIPYERLHDRLTDYLDDLHLSLDETAEDEPTETWEAKAKRYIQNWTNRGFLSNYQNEFGEIFFELSSHSIKTIDWLCSLKKEDYVGTESKFRNIFYQLNELVEFTNKDVEKRLELLEEKKIEIEQQIQKIKTGEDVKVFEDFELLPRFNQLNKSAKDLLSDFKEVEGNFKDITKEIYHKHAQGSFSKSHILDFTFDAIDELKNSQQGKSFYAFYNFILTPTLQDEWDKQSSELYKSLDERGVDVSDYFLKGMRKNLHSAGQKVSKANEKMAEKLSRIIRENENTKSEIAKTIINEIKGGVLQLSKTQKRPNLFIRIEAGLEINIPFERKITFEQKTEILYDANLSVANQDITSANQIHKLYSMVRVNSDVLRMNVNETLKHCSQTTIGAVVERVGGIKNGLPELLGYFGILKDYKYTVNTDKTQNIAFCEKEKKIIKIPEIIITK